MARKVNSEGSLSGPVHSRFACKSRMLRFFTNIGEGINDDGHEDVHEPEVEQDDAEQKVKAGDEVLCIDHVVHLGSPAIRSRGDDYLHQCSNYVVEALGTVVWVVSFLHVTVSLLCGYAAILNSQRRAGPMGR